MYYINTLKHDLSTDKTYACTLLDERSVVDRHRCRMATKFDVFFHEDHCKLPRLYGLSKLNKRPYKLHFIANSSSHTTTDVSILLISCLTAIKKML